MTPPANISSNDTRKADQGILARLSQRRQTQPRQRFQGYFPTHVPSGVILTTKRHSFVLRQGLRESLLPTPQLPDATMSSSQPCPRYHFSWSVWSALKCWSTPRYQCLLRTRSSRHAFLSTQPTKAVAFVLRVTFALSVSTTVDATSSFRPLGGLPGGLTRECLSSSLQEPLSGVIKVP
jgi:hypothetical protein